MAKLYTKTGDDGTTGLIGGGRVGKESLRIEAIGEVDELNAMIGLCRNQRWDLKITEILQGIQRDLFVLGTDLSTPMDKDCPVDRMSADSVNALENMVDEFSEKVEELENFILPGGCDAAASLHMARAICRRTERTVAALQKKEDIGKNVLPYLNRLSDLLFVLARYANDSAGVAEEKWIGKDTTSE